MNGLKARAGNIDPFYKWYEQPLSVTAISSSKLKTKCIFESCMKGSEQESFN